MGRTKVGNKLIVIILLIGVLSGCVGEKVERATPAPTTTQAPITAAPITQPPTTTIAPTTQPPTTTPPAPKVIRIEETDPAFVWSLGAWKTESHPGASGGTLKVTDIPGGKVDISFTGTGIALLYATHPNMGIAHIKIDGISYPDIDMYSPTPEIHRAMVIAKDLPNTMHTLTIINSASKNPAAMYTAIDIDAIEVTVPP